MSYMLIERSQSFMLYHECLAFNSAARVLLHAHGRIEKLKVHVTRPLQAQLTSIGFLLYPHLVKRSVVENAQG